MEIPYLLEIIQRRLATFPGDIPAVVVGPVGGVLAVALDIDALEPLEVIALAISVTAVVNA